MDRAARAKRLAGLNEELSEAYALLRTVLLTLPVPMLIVKDQADDPAAAVHALSRCWELVEYEAGISRTRRRHLRGMITDWLTAYELAVAAAQNGPGLWRINGIEAALGRFRASARHVATHRR